MIDPDSRYDDCKKVLVVESCDKNERKNEEWKAEDEGFLYLILNNDRLSGFSFIRSINRALSDAQPSVNCKNENFVPCDGVSFSIFVLLCGNGASTFIQFLHIFDPFNFFVLDLFILSGIVLVSHIRIT